MRDLREIELLRQLLPSGKTIDLTKLSETTGIGFDEWPVILESFEKCGFVFRRTEKTICVTGEPQALIPEMILAGLRTTRIGRDVLVLRETSSTNDRVRQAGVAGADEGLVIFAESQTGGRGTRGRRWVSSAGAGLWLSILLRTQITADQWPVLVQMAALACAEAVEKWVKQTVRIKPPNDLMLGGGKVAGFLLETSNTWDFQVLGIGLNVRSAPLIEGYPTAAVEQFTSGRPVSRAALASDLLNHFEEWYLKKKSPDLFTAFADRIEG